MNGLAAALLNYRIDFRGYMITSTIAAVFLQQYVAHRPFEVASGYILILFNIMLLLSVDQLKIHRNHAAYLGVLTFISLVAGRFAGTPANSVFSQVVGIAVMSIYFFSVLTTYPLTVFRWMELYSRFALAVVIYGVSIALYLRLIGRPERLTAIYSEPSVFISVTLPAFGFYANEYLRRRQYGKELLIFLLSYYLADSSGGFIGLILLIFFAVKRRVKGWKLLAAAVTVCAGVAALYFSSENLRLRLHDTTEAIVAADLSSANSTTYAMLSNLYGASMAFKDHPLFGVGIGGYQYSYMYYLGDVLDQKQREFGLNMYDANSLFFRVPAELGLFGLISLFGFLIVCSRVQTEKRLVIRNALLPYFLERFYHSGQYFTTELYFFVGLFVLNYLDNRHDESADLTSPKAFVSSATGAGHNIFQEQ